MPEQVIQNSAAIYFDFNEPVITNTTTNVVIDYLVQVVDIENNDAELKVYPNPAEDYFWTDLSEGLIQVFDVNGRLLERKTVQGESVIKINSTNYPKGLYFIELKNKELSIARTKVVID